MASEGDIRYANAPTGNAALFHFEGTVDECIERQDADRFLERLKSEKDVPKIEIPIAVDEEGVPIFSSFVQNIVVTHGIEFEREEGIDPQKHLIEHKLSLPHLARHWRYLASQYNPQRFDAVIRRSNNYDSATLYFNSGRLVETGCSRPELALDQLRYEQKMLREVLPWKLSLCHPQLQNIVSSGRFHKPICVNYMAAVHSDICSKVGRFPGTMIKDPFRFGNCALLVFPSGNFCHSGGRSLEQIYEHMKQLYPLLIECQATEELKEIDDRCRRRLAKITRPDQYVRERKSLLRYIEKHKKGKKRGREVSTLPPRKKARVEESP